MLFPLRNSPCFENKSTLYPSHPLFVFEVFFGGGREGLFLTAFSLVFGCFFAKKKPGMSKRRAGPDRLFIHFLGEKNGGVGKGRGKNVFRPFCPYLHIPWFGVKKWSSGCS